MKVFFPLLAVLVVRLDTRCAQPYSRRAEPQQLAEIENLKNHSRNTEDQLMLSEQKLANLEEQLGLDKQRLTAPVVKPQATDDRRLPFNDCGKYATGTGGQTRPAGVPNRAALDDPFGDRATTDPAALPFS